MTEPLTLAQRREDEMPERIWAGDFDKGLGHCTAGMQGGLYEEYVRADLAEANNADALAAEAELSLVRKDRDRLSAELAEARKREERLQALLVGRDVFIVEHGLWGEFTATLPFSPTQPEAKEVRE